MTEHSNSIKANNPLAFKNQEDRDILSDEMISLRFLSQVEKIMEAESISKKELASRLKTSASYITQLFQGDKLINVRLLTRLKRALNVNIDISCHPISMPIKALSWQAQELEHVSPIQLVFFSGAPNDMTVLNLSAQRDINDAYGTVYNLTEDESGCFSIDANSLNLKVYGDY